MILFPKLVLDNWDLLGSIFGAHSVQFFYPFSDVEFGSFVEGRFLRPFYICVYCDFAPKARFGRLDPFGGAWVGSLGTRNSHYRCGSLMFSVLLAFGWPSKFAFSLRFPSVFCDSTVWLAL